MFVGMILVLQSFIGDDGEPDPKQMEHYHPVVIGAPQVTSERPTSIQTLAILGVLAWVAGGGLILYDQKTRGRTVLLYPSPWKRVRH